MLASVSVRDVIPVAAPVAPRPRPQGMQRVLAFQRAGATKHASVHRVDWCLVMYNQNQVAVQVQIEINRSSGEREGTETVKANDGTNVRPLCAMNSCWPEYDQT